MAETLSERVEEIAMGPKRVQGDAGEVEAHNPLDVAKAQQIVSAGEASGANARRGLRFTRLILPGSI
jgi:hypothetical protein